MGTLVMSASLRRTLRVPLPVEIVDEGGVRPRFLGYLANISATGLFVQCARPRDMGTRLSLRFRLPGTSEPIHCAEAEVVWTRGYGGRSGPAPGMGIRMCALTADGQARIAHFCGEHPTLTSTDAEIFAPA
jgi:uncharacterized protein (TIGR02266 family)